MGDSIVFLGTGGDAIVVGKQYRASGGIIVQSDDVQFHIDPGPGALVMARMADINLRENTAVFVSHNHINHANDVNAVISAMTYNGMDKRGVLVANKVSLYGSDNDSPFVNQFYRKCVEKFMVVEPGSKLGVKNIDITCTSTHHMEKGAVGFRFIFPRFVLGYTGDTGYTKEMAEAFANTDILIICVTHAASQKEKYTMNTEDAAKLIATAKPKLAVITHFGVKMLQADPLYEAREIQKKTKIQTISANDGMTINPISFSASTRQITLKSF